MPGPVTPRRRTVVQGGGCRWAQRSRESVVHPGSVGAATVVHTGCVWGDMRRGRHGPGSVGHGAWNEWRGAPRAVLPRDGSPCSGSVPAACRRAPGATRQVSLIRYRRAAPRHALYRRGCDAADGASHAGRTVGLTHAQTGHPSGVLPPCPLVFLCRCCRGAAVCRREAAEWKITGRRPGHTHTGCRHKYPCL